VPQFMLELAVLVLRKQGASVHVRASSTSTEEARCLMFMKFMLELSEYQVHLLISLCRTL